MPLNLEKCLIPQHLRVLGLKNNANLIQHLVLVYILNFALRKTAFVLTKQAKLLNQCIWESEEETERSLNTCDLRFPSRFHILKFPMLSIEESSSGDQAMST